MIVWCLLSSQAQKCPSCPTTSSAPQAIHDLEQKSFEAVIYSPRNGDRLVYGSEVSFQGGSDESSASADWSYTYLWSSNRDGQLSTQKFFSTKTLSYGDHVINFKVTKTNYNRTISKASSSTINIRVEAPELSARITSPRPEGLYIEEENIIFSAKAFGGIPPYRFDWQLSGGTFLGSGNDFAVKVPAGDNEVRLKVTDAQGKTYETNTVFQVVAAKEAVFTASIVAPTYNDSYHEGDAVSLIAYASGGTAPYIYHWYLDGLEVDSIKSITRGEHTITLKVSDSRGVLQSDSITLKVSGPCDVNTFCEAPRENYAKCPQDCPSGSADGFCDGMRDNICDPDCGRQKDPDCLCNRNTLCEPDYENNLICPQDCPSGLSDKYCDAVKDGRCDPDCTSGHDPDCWTIYNLNYFILLVLVVFIILFYIRFVRR